MEKYMLKVMMLVAGLFLLTARVIAQDAPVAGGTDVPAREGASLSLSVTSTRGAKLDAAPAGKVPTGDADTYDGIPVGFTAEGNPYLGSPDAPVVLEEWSDYLCPYCGRHFRQTLPALKEQYLLTGQMQLVFRDLPFASLHPMAARGHVAARCVAKQGGAKSYWAMHEELFRRQGEWNRLPDPADFLAEVARGAGADMTAYEACVSSAEVAAAIEASVAEGRGHGFNGTPSFRFIEAKSGEDYTLVGAHPLEFFSRRIDALVAGEIPPDDPKPKPPEMPLWAKAEGLAADPDRPGFNKAGDAFKGNAGAKLTVIEFTDLQCPSCARHALETQPALDAQYVETGKVQWVMKHFPLRMHPRAAVAAAAAECAADQGRFWDMQHHLFEKQDTWTEGDVDTALVGLAAELKLDTDVFETCLNSRQALERVLRDLYDAQGVVSQTPTFLIVHGETGSSLRGARPAEQFAKVLDRLLEKAEAAESAAEKAAQAAE
jgi:protein-disulfide isomerase